MEKSPIQSKINSRTINTRVATENYSSQEQKPRKYSIKNHQDSQTIFRQNHHLKMEKAERESAHSRRYEKSEKSFKS